MPAMATSTAEVGGSRPSGPATTGTNGVATTTATTARLSPSSRRDGRERSMGRAVRSENSTSNSVTVDSMNHALRNCSASARSTTSSTAKVTRSNTVDTAPKTSR